MAETLSTLGLQTTNIKILTKGQSELSLLSNQLASGVRSQDLTDYTGSEAQNLMNFQNELVTRQSYLNNINTIGARIEVYDQSLSDIENIASQILTLVTSTSSYNESSVGTQTAEIQGAMDTVRDALNQKVGDRYIFSGTRYSTAPCGDIKTLVSPPTETSPYLAADDTLPSYDTNYTDWDAATDNLPNPNADHADAYVQDQVAVDSSRTLKYGITSTQDGFQQLVMGLRYAYAATQDEANYATYMETAADLIEEGLNAIRGYHTSLSSANASMNSTKEMQTEMISSLETQINNIQGVDTTEIAAKIVTYQSVLEASYSAVASLTKLSILNYL